MSQGFYGFPNILGLLRGTNLKVLGKAGATAGAGLAGGTTSGAPTAGAFDVGEAVIGADGTLFICTASGSPGTWVQLGTLVDPLTTRGDLIVRGASSTGRLALGTTNYVLTSNGTDVVWAVSPAGAGGALTQIAQTVLGSAASSITFSSIPGSYTNLMVIVTGYSTTNDYLLVRFNGDTGSNYDTASLTATSGTTGITCTNSLAASAATIGILGGLGSDSVQGGSVLIDIPGYAGTVYKKDLFGRSGEVNARSANNIYMRSNHCWWRSTAAITSIALLANSGNMAASTVATLYGVS